MTKTLTANEKLERAKKSLQVSQEDLKQLLEQLEASEAELEQAILESETIRLRGKRKEKINKKISAIRSQIEAHKKTIHVLENRLPELERDARFETMKGEGIEEYRKAQETYIDILNEVPLIENLTSEISKVHDYIERISRVQREYLSQGKEINEFLINEKISKIGDVSIESLRSDRDMIDREAVREFSNQIVVAAKTLNDMGWKLFGLVSVEHTDASYLIEDPPKPHIHEECECGYHAREYSPHDNMWCLRETRVHAIDKNLHETVVLVRDGGFEQRPAWPCEESD